MIELLIKSRIAIAWLSAKSREREILPMPETDIIAQLDAAIADMEANDEASYGHFNRYVAGDR